MKHEFMPAKSNISHSSNDWTRIWPFRLMGAGSHALWSYDFIQPWMLAIAPCPQGVLNGFFANRRNLDSHHFAVEKAKS